MIHILLIRNDFNVVSNDLTVRYRETIGHSDEFQRRGVCRFYRARCSGGPGGEVALRDW